MRKSYFILLIFLSLLFSCRQNKQKKTIPDSRLKIIDASVINEKIKNGEDIAYRNATVTGDIDFTNSKDASLITGNLIKHYVNSAVVFYECTFKGKIKTFNKNKEIKDVSDFKKGLTFINCTFQDTVNFSYSDFGDAVNFSGSVFQKNATFKSGNFSQNGLMFKKAIFIKYAGFNMIHSFGNADFSDAVFSDNVLFQLSEFENPVYFNAVKFNKNIDFSKVKFNDEVFFNYSEFKKSVIFNTSTFKARTEFIKSKFKMITEFKNCTFFDKLSFDNAELTGIMTFENSAFYTENPDFFKIKINPESDYITKNTYILEKKRLK